MIKRFLFVFLSICACSQLYAQEKPYLGAEIRSIETFLYGKFEARMKTTETSGVIYSLFTFYDEPDFMTKWNEIDIEFLGRYSNEVQFNSITGNHTMHEKRQMLLFNPHADFHLYAFCWTPVYISWSIDGIEIYRQTGDYIKTMNKPQKIMMNVWPSTSADWAGKIDPKAFPVQAEYDFVNYYAYAPDKADSFQLKWTDNFDYFDSNRWQKATHTFDTNACTFDPENVIAEAGYLTLRLTKPVDDEIESTPSVLIQSAKEIANTSKKYAGYTAVQVDFYKPINRALYKPEYFSLSKGVIKHVYFDVDRKYVVLYVDGLNGNKMKGLTMSYRPLNEVGKKYMQDVVIK